MIAEQKRITLTKESEPFISEVYAVIEKTRQEILSGIKKEEIDNLIYLIKS